jgi:hypothetical protein
MAETGGGSNNMIIFLIIGIVAILLFGCQMGLTFICRVTGKKPGDPLLGSGTVNPTGVDLNTLTPEQRAALEEELGVEEFPRVSSTEAMEHIANMIVKDIDAGTFEQLDRNLLFELKADLFANYKSDLAEVAEFNDMRLQPLEGRALALYSRLLLELAQVNGIALAPGIESAFQTNLFAGSPQPGIVTAQRSVIIG